MESPQLAEAETDDERGLSRAQLMLLVVGACVVALILLNALSAQIPPPRDQTGRIEAHPVMWQLFLIFGSAFARPLPILTFGVMFAFTALIANRMRALSGIIAFICITQFVLALVVPVVLSRLGVVRASTFPDSSIASCVSFYGFAAMALLRRNLTRTALVVICAVVLALASYAFARLYFGIASPTDILGGVVLGLTIGGLAYMMLPRSDPAPA